MEGELWTDAVGLQPVLDLVGLGPLEGTSHSVPARVEVPPSDPRRVGAGRHARVSVDLEQLRLAQRTPRTAFRPALRGSDDRVIPIGALAAPYPRWVRLRNGAVTLVTDPDEPALAEESPSPRRLVGVQLTKHGEPEVTIR